MARGATRAKRPGFKMDNDEFVARNRAAWNAYDESNPWTVPVDEETIRRARNGDWGVLLTECKTVPKAWFPHLEGIDLLGLASGGGQQMPIFAALGARVTSFDNSDAQLDKDSLVARREGFSIRTVQGDMRDLSAFDDDSFDLIFHPVSNVFCPDVKPVWHECYRVLRPNGYLMAGFMNPAEFIFDYPSLEQGRFDVRFKLPVNEYEAYGEAYFESDNDPAVCFSHSYQDQFGGQCDAGFVIDRFYEDVRSNLIVNEYFPSYFATRARKLPTSIPGIRP